MSAPPAELKLVTYRYGDNTVYVRAPPTYKAAIELARKTYSELKYAPEDCFKFRIRIQAKGRSDWITLLVGPHAWTEIIGGIPCYEIIDVDLENAS
ncbi:uncharacterized protein PHACADRAFT_211179 [Phanerochaete carnosa HHB-10118-sp]|uniref:PB1 domain-containing protein n=1 Tax=Phanerochaete carnosa (strain HHB-10118-sp) TaxID=650164 RepID=K5W3I7_PHACS|nr:uncharacterized protein PHACADRAFT_211179 [Phanerochaete carnosa HHB-10118-sp]EKM53484.1 hypothetical protein PHACADRAFT_211179 [Phanerochaete carnosa HHB-10118-sp]